jgi:hypothetical protein
MGQNLTRQPAKEVLSPHPAIPLAIKGDYDAFIKHPDTYGKVDAQVRIGNRIKKSKEGNQIYEDPL